MSREGVSMRKVREILRLRIGIGLTTRQVADSCKVSTSTVSDYEKRFREAGLTWPLPEGMDDALLGRIVRSRLETARVYRPLPDSGYLIEEMRKPHVTLHLLWLEYRERHPEGYGYTQFCHYYNQAKEKVDVVLRQLHRAGEKLFTDYAGDTLKIVDPQTGELIPVYIFVAVLGASNYTYAEGVLAPLPTTRYEYAEWRTAKVNIDYHVAVAKHFYSVQYQLVRQQIEVRMTASTVEILYKNRRVASHIRSYAEGRFTTNPDHMPKSHRKYLEWTPSRIISWADTKGPNMAALVRRIIESKPHPEQGYRSCLGIIRLADLYPLDRMEAASGRALACNALSFRSMKSILEKGLDRVPVRIGVQEHIPSTHANIRGSDYYRRTRR